MHLSRAELFELFEVILAPFQTDNKEMMRFVLLMQLDFLNADPLMGRWRKTSQPQARMQMRVSSYKFCLNDIILIK